MRPRRLMSVAALALAGAMAGSACRRGVPARGYPGAPVILISIDTLRADRLPSYGYKAGQTPAIDKLAREGVLFEDVYSHCPMTLPAHASMLTGLLPNHHGVRDNIGFTLKEMHTTLAQRFKAAGYGTGAAVTAYVLRSQTGISRGFDFFDDTLETKAGTDNLGMVQRDGGPAVEALTRWMSERTGQRLFAFLHLYEPHSPYQPPERYAHLASPYDGEVAYADELVGRFLDFLRARGIYDRAVVVLTADHGEGLKQHGEEEHGVFLYREAVHVPLIVRLPGGARGGTRVSGTVSQVDIAATLLDLAVLPADGMDGVSLREAIGSGRLAPRPVYSETLYPRYHMGWSELYAATDGRLRYIKAPRPELYDLGSDAAETRNLVASRAALATGMDEWLTRTAGPGDVAAPGEAPQEVRERLQALGYVGSAGAPASGALPDPKDRIGSYEELKKALQLHEQRRDAEAVTAFRNVLAENPEMIDAWEVLGTTLVRMGRHAEGIEALQRTLRLDPARTQTHLALVKAYVLQGSVELAMKEAERAAATDPANGYEALAQLMLDLGELGRAAAFARRSLAADVRRPLSHFVLGRVAQRGARYADALDSFRRAEELRSQTKGAVIRTLHASIGDCLARLGRAAEAERAFKAEIEEMPASREGRVGLAMLYRSEGRDAEAREVLAGLVAAEPQPGADTYWTVVRTFTVLGDGPAAREWTARARARFPSDPRFR